MSKRLRAVAVALPLLAGCYGYVAQPGRPLMAGEIVALSLSDSGSVVLAPVLGQSVVSVAGRLDSLTEDGYRLAIEHTTRRDGTESDWTHELVVIPRVLVIDGGVKKFSTSRTALAVGLSTVALATAIKAFAGGGAGGPPGTVVTGGPPH